MRYSVQRTFILHYFGTHVANFKSNILGIHFHSEKRLIIYIHFLQKQELQNVYLKYYF